MKTPRCQLLSLILAAGASGSFAAEQPDSLSHSIPAPPMGVKKNADLGRAVAMDGNYLVAADPGADPAVINVFNPVTGALLFVLPNPSPTAGDGFGSSLAISGTRVVVGAPNDDTGASDAGSAYVYDLSSVTPMAPVATLRNPGPATDERFGYAVAVSGARVVVGAFRENTGAAWAGSAYVFDLTSATPTVPVVTLNDPDAEYSDYFGWSVAIFGTRVAVGAPGDDNHGANAAGSVYVYELSGGTPTVPVITWSNPSAAPSDGFGFSVALSDTRLIVGTNGDDEPGENAGSVSVYNLGSGTPTIPEATLSRPTPSQRFFGHRVAISGTRVVVLADGTGKSAYMYDLGGGTPTIPAATLDIPGNRVAWSAAIVGTRVAVGAPTSGADAAVGGGRVYLYDTGTATPGAPITALPGATPVVPAERFGSSIGISGSLVVIGAFEDDALPGVANAGNAYVYDLVSASPTVPALTLTNPSPAADDHFGYAVASSATRVVVGSPGKDLGAADAGGAYVYEVRLGGLSLIEATIASVVTLTNPSPAAGDTFGSAVAISDTWVVVGASSDDSGANDAGSAYVYKFVNAAPTTPTLALHNPSPAAGDGFGSSVAVSGTRVVVGAPHDDGGPANSGSAYVYEINSVTPSIPIAVLKSPSPAENEFFGNSVGISGSRAVVGAPGSGPDGAGRAFLYDVSSGTIPVAALNNPNPSPDDGFGSSVAISGTRAVVGTRTSETAYVYDFSSPTPATPVATLHDPNPLAGDHFGAAVAIDGTTATIGRPGNETVPNDAGSTYIFVPGWGLAKATDFGGDWITGSRPYNGVESYPGYWAGQSTVTLDGDAAEGRLDGPIAVETWMRTTVSGPTTLYFSYRVINLSGAYRGTGGLSLIIDGNSTLISPDMGDFGGDTGWRETSALIPAGVQTVQWKLFYRKGSSNGRAYIDQVSTSADGRPRITDASKRVGTFATPFTWDVPVSSVTPATVAAHGLPRGLTIDAIAHVISGTPLEAGTFEVTLTAQNTGGQHIAKVVFEIEPGTTTIAEGADAPALVFTQPDPGTAWRGAVGLGRDGVDCVRGSVGPASGMLPPTLSAVVVGPGTLSFWYRTEDSHLVLGEHAYLSFSSFQPTVSLSARNWTRATAQLPAGPQTVSWRLYKFGLGSNVTTLSAYLDQITLIPSDAPQIAVEELPQRTNVPAGGSQSFGAVLATTAASRSFTLKNIGLTSLTGLGTSIDGVDAGDFAVTHPPGAPVSGPTGSTSFAIQFSPTSPGPKSATLHIASNDPNVNPFDIILMGTGLELPRQMVEQGAPALFSVDASGATSMKWRKDGIDIPGATGATLSLPSVQPWHIGVYSVWITNGLDSPSVKTVGLLELSGVPTGLWRGLVACYPFNETSADLCRPSKPASLVNTSEFVADPQRGSVAHIQGKGFGVPPLSGEPADLQGPGGYLQIPRPPLVDGEPFTVSFVIKEEGFSYWHGESLITMGEGASSNDLISHYWVGSLDGSQETYGGPVVPVQTYNSDFVLTGSAVTLNSPWTGYAAVADGNILRLYRNGQLMGSSPYNKNTLGDSFMGRHWWENGAKYSTRLVAKVDDLRFYNRALTAPEVQQLYTLAQTTPPVGSFESWVLIHGLIGADAGLAADPDRDGLSNWEEYCFGTSPADGTESLMKAVVAGTTLTLTWLERDGVLYTLKESSELLMPWTQSPRVPSLAADQSGVPAGYERMQVNIPVPPTGSPTANRFFRVEASKVP